MIKNPILRGLTASIPYLVALAVFVAIWIPMLGTGRLTADQQALNLETFDYVWTTIRDKHFDPNLGGLDWQAVRDELRPQMESATTIRESRAILEEMTSRLGQSHFGVIPGEAYELMDGADGSSPGRGVTGIDLRVVDGAALVTSIVAGSPATEAEVQPGWEIVRVEGLEIRPLLESVDTEWASRSWRDLALAGTVLGRLRGTIGDRVTVEFLDGDDRRVKKTIDLAEEQGKRFKIGHIPTGHVWIDVHTTAGGVGYIAFSDFADPNYVMQTFNEAMEAFMDAPGLVIDVRGNEGGMGAMAIGMMGWLVPETRKLGTFELRGHTLNVLVEPRPTTYTGPVAVLADGLSVSGAELFASGLQDLGRARVFGSPTAGAVLGSSVERLPNGDGFQYVNSNYISAKTGRSLEGIGVIPDVEVSLDREALLAGKDQALDAAVRWIRNQESVIDSREGDES
jgi:carboxyl-terminal processing protease